MKIKILKDEFVKSNMLKISSDVECVFRIDSNFGLQGQLSKLNKSNGLTLIESLNILIGRLACVGEEWNYIEFTEESWENIYDPKTPLTQHILKEFSKIDSQLFDEKINQFIEYFSSREERNTSFIKINHRYSGSYKFNGENIANYFRDINIINNISELNLDCLDLDKKKSVYVNKDNWNWQLWLIETEKYHLLFEEVIIS